jgi:tuberous sclerosis protein 2
MQGNGRDAGGGIRHKLGSLFSPRGPPQAARGRGDDTDHSTFITADVLRELGEGVPVGRRVRAMRELVEIVASQRLEEYAVQAIWQAVRDLLGPGQPPETRQAVLQFLRALVQGQFSELGVMRAHFFRMVCSHQPEEDTQQRLELLVALTQGGKDIKYFEEEIGPFLVEWMPQLASSASGEGLLRLLVKLVHYNSGYLEEEVLSQLVAQTCSLATQATSPSETELCLSFLDAVVCYSVVPPPTIHPVIVTLCHTLNVERFIQRSLEVMQRLLGTHVGPTVIYTMCSLLQDKAHSEDVLLLRGAVFYISMSLWGVKRVETLALPFTAVLPAIHQACLSGLTLVVYEVALSVLRLVRHYSPRLGPREWESLHHILHATHRHLSLQGVRETSSAGQLSATLQAIFSSVEQHWEGGRGSIGPAHLFFQLLEEARPSLPVPSVLNLLLYHTQAIDAADLDWMQQLSGFMDKFYRWEGSPVVRGEALHYLGQVLAGHWLTQEEPLLGQVLLPFLRPLPLEADPDLRCQAVQLLVQFLPSTSSPDHALSMLDLVSQVLQRGLGEGPEARLPDCRAAVFGLTQLLREAVYRPGPLAGQVFSVLVQFLRQLYAGRCFTATSCVLRINVFNCLLSMRADSIGQPLSRLLSQ